MSHKPQDWDDLEKEQQSAEGQCPDAHTQKVPPDINFDDCILTSEAIKVMEIPERPELTGDWFKAGDLGFVFAPPGRGKSWFSMHLACCLSNNKPFGPWECPEHCKVLYVEGEMGLEAIKDRGARLADKGVQYLTYESVLDKKDTPLNLADVRQQKALLNACKDRGCNIIFIDNLSCLFSGVKENEADSWEMVLPWFLQFRRYGISVVVVHHTNRQGRSMRGTSKREDAAGWMIRLDSPADETNEDGARFISRFSKCRNARQTPQPTEWHFLPKPDGGMRVNHKEANNYNLLMELLDDGENWYNKDIAENLGLTKFSVSRLLKRAMEDGKVIKTNRSYRKK